MNSASNKSYSLSLLKKQFTESIFSVGFSDNNFFVWNVCFEGPSNSLYEGGIFNATLTFPDDFPNMPPKMLVHPDGLVCISILHPPGKDEYNDQEMETEKWRPILTVENILQSVISLLNDPNINSPANLDAAIEFRDNYDQYKKKVRKLARESSE